MQVTITIPDEFAAQVQAQGLSPERYIEQWAANLVSHEKTLTVRTQKLNELEIFFTEMAGSSESTPRLADQAFTRESSYQDQS